MITGSQVHLYYIKSCEYCTFSIIIYNITTYVFILKHYLIKSVCSLLSTLLLLSGGWGLVAAVTRVPGSV